MPSHIQLAKCLTRTVEFPVRGQKWPLIFTYRALFTAQTLTGLDMLSANLSNLSAQLVRALLFSAITCIGGECTEKDVGNSINRLGLKKCRELLVNGWTASMAEPAYKADANDNPHPDVEPSITWVDIWASSRDKDLGLSTDEWLDMTPRQFNALQSLQLARMRREEFMNGMLCATIENFSMCAPRHPVKPEAFMLHPYPALPIGEQIMAEMRKMRQR